MREATHERQHAGAQLGQRLLRLLAPCRVQSLSLHDAAGELVWLSQGAWTKVEQDCVREAADAFALEGSEQYFERTLDDGRRALFFCARTALTEQDGMACAILERSAAGAAAVEPPDLAAIRARVFAAMRRFSMPQATPEASRAPAAPDPEPIPYLRSRPYSRLRSTGTTRRYEIAGPPQTTLPQDFSRAQRLIQLIERRDARGAPMPATFTLPLCAASVLSWDFLSRLAPAIQSAGLTEGILGFRIPAEAWEQHGPATEHFLEQCATLGCFAALDDFNLRGNGFALLRHRAVRCLKLDPALTASLLNDKFSHATVLACVKAARVLGLYCVAKGVRSASTARWLGSAGIDYAERLNRGPAAAATTTSAPPVAVGT